MVGGRFKHNLLLPCVSGVLTIDQNRNQGEAFTGGSNLGQMSLLPQYSDQRRPIDFKSVSSLEAVLEKGIEMHLSSPNEKHNGTNVTVWFKTLAGKLEKCGLDTVFRIATGPGEEVFIAQDWGKTTDELVEDWIDQLSSTGVRSFISGRLARVCPCDLNNLHCSGTLILYSVTKKCHQEMKDNLGEKPHGPGLLCHVLSSMRLLL